MSKSKSMVAGAVVCAGTMMLMASFVQAGEACKADKAAACEVKEKACKVEGAQMSEACKAKMDACKAECKAKKEACKAECKTTCKEGECTAECKAKMAACKAESKAKMEACKAECKAASKAECAAKPEAGKVEEVKTPAN